MRMMGFLCLLYLFIRYFLISTRGGEALFSPENNVKIASDRSCRFPLDSPVSSRPRHGTRGTPFPDEGSLGRTCPEDAPPRNRSSRVFEGPFRGDLSEKADLWPKILPFPVFREGGCCYNRSFPQINRTSCHPGRIGDSSVRKTSFRFAGASRSFGQQDSRDE